MKFPSLRKNTDDVTLPREVQAYYEAEKRDRRGVAGLLAVGTLVVTILLAAGLFFGGRWAYQKIRNDDKKKPTVATTSTSSTKTDKPSDNSSNSTNSDSAESTTAVVNSGALGNGSSNATGTGTSGSSSNPTTNSTSTGTNAANTSGAAGNLPSTGSDGSVAAFICATLGSIVIAELYQLRKLTR
jgi:hypothetical protein